MKHLILLRHAKAAAGAESADHARPLNHRGRAEAAWIAGRFASQPVPDLVLCSTSTRTRETLDLAGTGWRGAAPVRYDRVLYLAEAATLIGHIASAVEDAVDRLLLVGHNPGLHDLALHLAQRAPALAALRSHFPPGAQAAFAIDAEHWSDLETAPITLESFAVPPRDD
ncbi:MAG TPA: histidine phosphatase family protein [Stellaceae bacterium]|nr:histidine phosphatase family protein [Stellaceae bacterium]